MLALFTAAGLTPRAALRISKSPAEDLGLTYPEMDDDTILAAMLVHPVLVNRPIVVSPKGVRLCRPSELVLEFLDGDGVGIAGTSWSDEGHHEIADRLGALVHCRRAPDPGNNTCVHAGVRRLAKLKCT